MKGQFNIALGWYIVFCSTGGGVTRGLTTIYA